MRSLAVDSSRKGRSRSFKLARRTREEGVAVVCTPSCESVSHADGEAALLGPNRAGPEPEPAPGLTGLGGAGGDVPPPCPEGGAGDIVSSRPGSSSRRDLGALSTAWPRIDSLLERG